MILIYLDGYALKCKNVCSHWISELQRTYVYVWSGFMIPITPLLHSSIMCITVMCTFHRPPPSLFLVLVSVINSIIDRGSKVWITISQMQ